MKSIYYIILLLVGGIILNGCETDENGPMPDSFEESSFPYIVMDADASDPFINLDSPESYSLSGTIDVLFKERVPFDKLRLVVAMNGAYDKAGTLQDNITSVPHEFTITGADIVNALDELNDFSTVTEEDRFHVYVIPTFNGKEFPPYQVLGGKVYNTVSSGIYTSLTSIKGVNSADVPITVMLVCPLENGTNDLVGSWAGDDAWFESIITTEVKDETSLNVSGMGVNFIEQWWSEPVVDSEPVTLNVTEFGTVEIPRQYLFTTTYEGAEYDYEIKGSGFWNNCGETPTLIIEYDIYYAGAAAGLAATYAAYLNGIPYLTADVELSDGSKSATIVEKSFQITKPVR